MINQIKFILNVAQVNEMDWVGVAWPLALRELQKDSTNFLNHMMYPKVQKCVVKKSFERFQFNRCCLFNIIYFKSLMYYFIELKWY